MNALRLRQICVAVIAGIGFSASIQAGDKITFSDQKPQTEPGKELNASDLFKSSPRIDQSAMDYEVPGLPSVRRPGGRLTRDEEMRLKLKRDEEKNWLLVKPGELQKRYEEENASGAKGRPLNDFTKKGDYTLYGVGEPKEGADQAAKQAALQQRAREEAEAESHRPAKFELGGSSQPGAHTANELNLTKLFDPAQKDTAAAADGSKPDFSLQNLMGTALPRSKEQQALLNDFNKLINPQSKPPQPLFAAPGSISSPIGSAATPSFTPKPVEAHPSAGDLFRQSQNGSLQGRLDTPGLPPNLNPSLNSGSPFQRQMPDTAASDASKNWMKPIEPVRRKF